MPIAQIAGAGAVAVGLDRNRHVVRGTEVAGRNKKDIEEQMVVR
jgi:hypothetical protein